jgi:hypothetical protein
MRGKYTMLDWKTAVDSVRESSWSIANPDDRARAVGKDLHEAGKLSDEQLLSFTKGKADNGFQYLNVAAQERIKAQRKTRKKNEISQKKKKKKARCAQA